jgi:hypothetical protein
MKMLSFQRLSKAPKVYKSLSGLSLKEFNDLIKKIEDNWNKLEAKKRHHGRNSHLPRLEDKILCVLIYYRTYITHTFLGYLFNLHNSNICRLFKKIEPLLAKKIVITKDRALTPETIIKILADVSEQATQRLKKKQKKSYSGKKKSHTIKTEVVMEESGKIINVSKSHKGKIHDFRIRRGEKLLPMSSIKHADSGYQGWQKLQSNVVIPYKETKKKSLTEEQKLHNKNHASFRMKVEHKIRETKIFKIMRNTYRNFQKKYNLRFNIIAGIVNLKHGF